ncbi:MAG: exopolyphosphatase [Thermodesulfobacteriota bacterium]|nr:exopolyphosphatase [Thermodesulfobacteriota bacterium]
MRIVTRPDFDGVVCAALLYEAEKINEPVKWVEPGDMQKGMIEIRPGDIIANLPYHEKCSLWFDHHYTNTISKLFNGAFKIAPSAAGIIYEYYRDKFTQDYSELIKQTDKIDSADLSLDEVRHPENYPYLLLSMTISGRIETEEAYWNRVVHLLRRFEIGAIINDQEVSERFNLVKSNNKKYKALLKKHTKIKNHVSITDFRSLDETPEGNRFLAYSLFPQSSVNVKIRYDDKERQMIAISVGHSIFNKNCHVNVGLLLSSFEGGGHQGAAACRFHVSKADDYVGKIIEVLVKNEPIED